MRCFSIVNEGMKRPMSKPYSHRGMIIGEFHVASEKQNLNT